jgi:hypothetical protein
MANLRPIYRKNLLFIMFNFQVCMNVQDWKGMLKRKK